MDLQDSVAVTIGNMSFWVWKTDAAIYALHRSFW
jgi:hypothetical protein